MSPSWTDSIRESLGPPLKSALAPLDHFLSSLPMGAARACALGLFLAAGIWVLTQKRSFVYLGAPDQAAWRDLRVWSWIVLVPYIAIYWFFG